ncbi:MAG: transporter [Bacteroidales bacterium]|nr:transporter [Bacteroidales bacterium]
MKRILFCLICLVLSILTFSQEEDRLLVTEIKQSTVITEPATLRKGFFRIGSIFTYAVEDKVFDDNRSRTYSTGNGWGKYSTESLQLVYGFTNRIELALVFPYKFKSIHLSFLNEVPFSDTSLLIKLKTKGNGLGDITVGVNIQIIEGSKNKPSLTGTLTASLPTGRKDPTNIKDLLIYDYPTGSGELSLIPELIFRKVTYPFSWSLFAGLQYGFGCDKIMVPNEEVSHFKSGIRWQTGGNFNFLVNDWIAIQNELVFDNKKADTYKGNTILASTPGYDSWALFYSPGLSFQFKKFRLNQGFAIPLAGKMTMADPQFNLTLQYIL